MPNRPDYMAIWLGFTRVGGIVALVNTNLVGARSHCIDIVEPKHVIVAADLCEDLPAPGNTLRTKPASGRTARGSAEFPNIDGALDDQGEGRAATDARSVTTADCALFIYTSGTTGLPKAAKISHGRLMMWSHWFAGMIGTRPGDRMYNCLPMYHSVGGVVATGAMLVGGGSVVIREKFSARQFWDDLVRFDCTLFPVHRRTVPLSRQQPAASARARTGCGSAATGCGRRVGGVQEPVQIPESSNSTRRPKATSRCSMSRASPARSAHPAFSRASLADGAGEDSMSSAASRCATQGLHSLRPERSRRGAGQDRRRAAGLGGRFEGYTGKEETERKILRDVSRTATPGSAPAT
jgi:fatty-acyl-CoA synthase